MFIKVAFIQLVQRGHVAVVNSLRRQHYLLLLLSVFLFFTPAFAQETTPEATPNVPEFVASWSSILIYPEAVRFNMVIGRPLAEIASLTLTINAPGRTSISITVDPAEAVTFTDTYTELVYIWQIPIDTPPLFQTEVDYSWRVVLTDNQSANDVPGSFFFSDERTEWVEDNGEDSNLKFIVPEGSELRTVVRDELESVYDLLAQNHTERPEVKVILFNDALPISPCSEGKNGTLVVTDVQTDDEYVCDPRRLESIFAEIGYTPLQSSTFDRADLEDTLVSFMVERFYAALWANGSAPDWFKFALTQFYLPTGKPGYLSLLQNAARGSRLYTLPEMQAGNAEDALWQAQSYAMVLYIAHQTGVSRFFDLANLAEETSIFTEAYEQVVGLPLNTLLPNMGNWIYTDAAQSDFFYTPYLAATPQPTPSRTITPFPPTLTYTPSATASDTPTVTVTGFLSATPLPSLTPSATGTAAPLSVTPRPASSLYTPTPLPLPTIENTTSGSNNTLALGVIGLIFLVFVILTIIYMRLLGQQNKS